VDHADYGVWRTNFGRTGVGLAADGNGNGKIDAADYVVWRKSLPAPVAGYAVAVDGNGLEDAGDTAMNWGSVGETPTMSAQDSTDSWILRQASSSNASRPAFYMGQEPLSTVTWQVHDVDNIGRAEEVNSAPPIALILQTSAWEFSGRLKRQREVQSPAPEAQDRALIALLDVSHASRNLCWSQIGSDDLLFGAGHKSPHCNSPSRDLLVEELFAVSDENDSEPELAVSDETNMTPGH
jgi:hypothetical protein